MYRRCRLRYISYISYETSIGQESLAVFTAGNERIKPLNERHYNENQYNRQEFTNNINTYWKQYRVWGYQKLEPSRS